MAKIKVFKKLDGSVIIMHFNWSRKLPTETDEEFMQRWISKLSTTTPELLTSTVIDMDDSNLPLTKENRDCWTHSNGKVEIDPVKLAAKQAKAAEKIAKKNNLLSKLKLTEEELKDLKEVLA